MLFSLTGLHYSTIVVDSAAQSFGYFILNYLFDIFYWLLYVLWFSLRLYMTLVDIRFLLSWLLVVNPYYEPLETLWKITSPVFKFGVKLYPRILGMQSAPYINTFILQLIEAPLNFLCHLNDEVNVEQFYDPQDWVRPGIQDLRTYDPNYY